MGQIKGYSKNANVQMLISLLLAHNIHKVIVSPGGTHNEIVLGMQYNGNFELYSTVDERGAAYMAVGMATACNEPVCIVCTESVASRNYYPAITEAFYRQLPILAITGVHGYSKIGHLIPQVIDRSESPRDTFRLKVHLPEINNSNDIWESNILINKALLELKHHGGGPVHIDLPRSNEEPIYSEKELIQTRVIRRYIYGEGLPPISYKKIAIFIGTHQDFSEYQTEIIDRFCDIYNAAVFCGHTSGYKGKYRLLTNLVASQLSSYDIFNDIDLLIHIGSSAADTETLGRLHVKEVWRVNPDGEIRDTLKVLSCVFEMKEEQFFLNYCNCHTINHNNDFFQNCLSLTSEIKVPLSELPFSNIYAAAQISKKFPANAFLFIGGSSTIRGWNKFDFPKSTITMGNMGTRGIDGVLSSFIGASFVYKEKICYCVLGDLTFFYDMNAIGNRDIGNNIRIMLVNNNGGGLFKSRENKQNLLLGEDVIDLYIAAAGHFGNQSSSLVKGYAESLGFEYLTASNKNEFDSVYERFVTPEKTNKPMLFELFTNSSDERKSFDIMANIDVSIKGAAKQVAKKLLGQKGVNVAKKLLNNDKKN